MQKQSLTLLQSRRFLPLFIVQFLEAFNDLLFKTALVTLIAFVFANNAQSSELLVALGGAVYILPYIFLSAIAGQLADKYDKTVIIRIIKVIEIAAFICGAVGFYLNNLTILMGTLFLLGTHSTFFGPIKYAILPEHLKKQELISGNALIEASTFLSILLGTIIGGLLINIHFGAALVSILGIVGAIVGLAVSFYIPAAKSTQPNLKISLNFIKETFAILKTAKENKNVFLCVLGISWFWLFGVAFMTQFPTYTRYALFANNDVFTLFLALFSLGIGVGSMLSDQIQRGRIDARFVPLGILGMTIFTIDLYFASAPVRHTDLIGIATFLSSWHSWRILVDTFLISICAGIYVVPLFTIVQHLSRRTHRSRIIAANNVINSIFMVVATLILIIFTKLNFSVTGLFLVIGIINLGVAIYICKLLPDELIKSILSTVLKTLYRVKVEGIENYMAASPKSIIVANHVSFLDGVLLSVFLPGRVLFAITTQIAQKWWVKPILKLADAFPIDPTNPMATKALIRNIRQNRRCFIFPEGRLTVTGGLMKIYEGPGLIADKTGADIIPIRIDGAQYSYWSRLKNKVRTRVFPQITIRVLPARKFVVDESFKGRERRMMISDKLYDLMTDLMFESSPYKTSLLTAVFNAKNIHGEKHVIIEDSQRKPLNYQQLISRIFILGQYINKHTATDEKVIGILLPNSIACVVNFFAIQCYGRIPSLLNFSSGTKNLLSACETAEIKTIYTSHKFIENANLSDCITKLAEAGIHMVYTEDLKNKINVFNKLSGLIKAQFAETVYNRLNPTVSCEDPAVILFTSGSEGSPKGVVLSHKNILANNYQMAARVAFNRQDIAFNVLPMFHAFGLTAATILPIISGIKVFLYPSPLHYRIVPEMIYDADVTIFFGTDTFLANYAKNAHPYDFYSVRYIFSGAEKLKPETARIWIEKFGVRVFEGYGATEMSPVVSTNTPMHNKIGTVGRFLPNLQYKLEPVHGINEGGRLFLAGPTLMKGYLFADNPGVIVSPADGWYDTGDIVSVDAENYITIQGRAKRFAKLGGEMVSLAAIEQTVSTLYPDQLHAAVAVPDEKKGEVIVLVTDHKNATREEIIKYFQKQDLAEIYLPKKIIFVEEMFVLGSGKIDIVAVQKYVEEIVG